MKHSRIIKTFISAVLILQTSVLCGCSSLFLRVISGGDKKYSSSFDDAHDYAQYWCGPCKEIDSYSATDDCTIHKMKDEEYGFTYIVSELKMTDTLFPYHIYHVDDFSYYYLKEFLDEADLYDLIKEYDISIEVKEPVSKNPDIPEITGYSPEIAIKTDRELSAEDNSVIAKTFLKELERFDSDREVYTKEDNNACVFIHIESAPRSEDAGKRFHLETTTYGLND